MQGRKANKNESSWLDKVTDNGCYCCKNMGYAVEQRFTLAHHIDGCRKDNCHYLIIGLCDRHHSRYHETGLHHNKYRWLKKWGLEADIVQMLHDELDGPLKGGRVYEVMLIAPPNDYE